MIRTVAQTGSTNDDVLALARAGAPEGMWLRADTQSGGRGRSGRAWVSPPGNLYASTLVRLGAADPLAPSLALVAGLAVADAARAFAPDAALMLKWPNDLLCGGAKLAGLLLEGEGRAVVCGFGVNLAHHPDLPDRPATSLAACIDNAAPSPGAFVETLAAAFARRLAQWRQDGIDTIRAAWCAVAHPPGTVLRVDPGDGTRIEGLFDGLDPMGALRLRLADDTVRVIQAGDVFLGSS